MPIIDQAAADSKFDVLEELGRSGFAEWYGNIEERFIKELYGLDGIKVFDEMHRRDPSLRAILFATKLTARTAEWRAVSPTDKPGPEVEAADYLQSCSEDMSHTMSDAVDFQLSMLPFGWAWQEICYKRRQGRNPPSRSVWDSRLGKTVMKPDPESQFEDGRIGWRKWAPRKQKSWAKWQLDDAGGVEGLWQSAQGIRAGGAQIGWQPATSPMGQRGQQQRRRFIPIEKSLHFTTENAGGDPEGISIFESCYEHWFFLKNLLPTLGIGFERSFVGVPKFMPESGLSDDDKAALATVGTGLRVGSKSYVTLPPAVQMELLTVNNTVAAPMLDTIQYFRTLMLQSALADWIALGGGETGSWALGTDKSAIFFMVVNGYLDKIQAVLNRFAVPRLFAYNDFPGLVELPELQHTTIEKVNLAQLGQFMQQIGPLLGTLETEDQIWLRARSGMPEMELDEEGNSPSPPPLATDGVSPGEGELSQSPFDAAEFADPPGRPDEAGMTVSLLQVLTDRRQVLAARLASRQRVPPDSYWEDEARDLIHVLIPLLEAAAIRGVLTGIAPVEALGIGVDWTLVNTAAVDWARTHAGKLVKEITETSQKALSSQIASWMESGEPLPKLFERLEPIYGAQRAELIGVTETTRAYAEGSKIAWAESGVVQGYKWNTVNDDIVRKCPICWPLHGVKVKAGEAFPGGLMGPEDSHPRCRCWLTPVMIGEKV